MTAALASRISGAGSCFGGEVGGGFEEGGDWVGADWVGEEVDGEEAGSCGYRDVESSIARVWRSFSRELDVFDEASILASSIDADASSTDPTV